MLRAMIRFHTQVNFDEASANVLDCFKTNEIPFEV